MPNNLLITGAYGFVGLNLVKVLAPFWEWDRILIIDKRSYASNEKLFDEFTVNVKCPIVKYHVNLDSLNDYVRVDYAHTYKDLWKELAQVTHIVHLAAESHVDNSIIDPESFLYENHMAIHSLLFQLAAQYQRRKHIQAFIHISTDEVYGPNHGPAPYTEEQCFAPSNPYSTSKATADLIAQFYMKHYYMPIIILRPCNMFGPYQHEEKFIPHMVRNVCAGRYMTVYGDGGHSRQWLYVRVFAHLIQLLLFPDYTPNIRRGIFNVSSGIKWSNYELCQLIGKLCVGEGKYSIENMPDRLHHDFSYDTTTNSHEMNVLLDEAYQDACGINSLEKTIRHYIDVYSKDNTKKFPGTQEKDNRV